MKNGRALKGHKRVLVARGTMGPRQRPPSGGWEVGCICGWRGGNWPRSEPAIAAYRKHLDQQIDECLFRCKRCGVEKLARDMRTDYRYICRDCYSDIGNEWQRKHPVETARCKRNHSLLKRFGITVDEAEQLLASQGGVCAICRRRIEDGRGYSPHVDHDHVTGKVRGILCLQCNSGLGHFRDQVDLLKAAIEYLEWSSARTS